MPTPLLGLMEFLSNVLDFNGQPRIGKSSRRRQAVTVEQVAMTRPPPGIDRLKIIHAGCRIGGGKPAQQELRQPVEELRLGQTEPSRRLLGGHVARINTKADVTSGWRPKVAHVRSPKFLLPRISLVRS